MIPLYKPYMPPELPEIENILQSGKLSYGKWGKEFEKLLRDYVGVNNLMTTNTYSSAIQIALSVLGLKPGDEVITSPMSCMASNMPLAAYGLKVKWCDVDSKTGTLSPDYIKTIISSDTKLIFHNHYCGYIGYVDEINAIAKEYNIPVIDDFVEAFGSEYKNRKAGNLGSDISIFSFQTVRLPNTIDGGAIAFSNPLLFRKAKIARDLGIERTKFRDKWNEISPLCDIPNIGFAATMNELNSYIGCVQMNKLSNLLQIQRKNAEKWEKWFESNYPLVYCLNRRKEITPNYWVFGFLAENKQYMMEELRKQGYYSSGVHLNNNCYSVFGSKDCLSGVNEFYKKFLALPSGWWAVI